MLEGPYPSPSHWSTGGRWEYSVWQISHIQHQYWLFCCCILFDWLLRDQLVALVNKVDQVDKVSTLSPPCMFPQLPNRPGLIAPSSSSKPLPVIFLLLLVYYLRKQLSLSISDWFWGVCNFQNLKILPIKSIFKIVADVWCDLSKLGREGH